MNLELADDQLLLKESFERLFKAESSSVRVRAAEPAGFDAALWRDLAEMGALMMRVPEGQGGGGFSLLDAQIVAEEAGKALASAPLIEAIVTSALLARLAGANNDAAQALLALRIVLLPFFPSHPTPPPFPHHHPPSHVM